MPASALRPVRAMLAPGLALIVLLASALPAATQDLPARYMLNPALSRVWFDAQASLGSFRGTAYDVVGWAQVPDTAGFVDARGKIEVLVAGLRTGIGLRDRHLREEMQATRYPLIVFNLERAEPPLGPGSESAEAEEDHRLLFLHGALTLRGTTREVDLPATVSLHGDTLRVHGQLPLLLTDYGIDPPSRILGTARMRNQVELNFDLVFLALRQ